MLSVPCIYSFLQQGYCHLCSVLLVLFFPKLFWTPSTSELSLFASPIQLIGRSCIENQAANLDNGLNLNALRYYIRIIGFGVHDEARKCHGYVTVIKETLDNWIMKHKTSEKRCPSRNWHGQNRSLFLFSLY